MDTCVPFAEIGPITKWVDDHLFFRIRREHIASYNRQRLVLCSELEHNGAQHSGGQVWYKGRSFTDKSFDVHAENYLFPSQDLSTMSPHSDANSLFSFAFCDIDYESKPLGIPWEPSKDIAFAFITLYLSLLWNITRLTVKISPAKKSKYCEAISSWCLRKTHVLLDVQQLYGKLLHACLVVPAGCAYLTSLEAMLGICSSRPFVPHHVVKHIANDLDWWYTKLSLPFLGRCISRPSFFHDVHGFSDASTSFGIAIVIHGYWWAWTLRPGWETRDRQRDIGWAECLGFELLVLTILDNLSTVEERHFHLFCDNQGIVNAWRNGRSRNWETNIIFCWIHEHLDQFNRQVSFHLCYVPSRDNLADGSSRGIFPSARFLLPPITLPIDVSRFLTDANVDCHLPSHLA